MKVAWRVSMCRSVYSASKMYMRHAVVRFDAVPKDVVSDVLAAFEDPRTLLQKIIEEGGL